MKGEINTMTLPWRHTRFCLFFLSLSTLELCVLVCILYIYATYALSRPGILVQER